MHLMNSLIESFNNIFINGVSGKSDPEVVIGATHELDDRVFAFIVDIVRTQVNMFELYIL